MQRETILTVTPPTERTQSLPVLPKVDESLDEASGGKQHKLNLILVEPATDITSIGKSNSTPASILLSTFPSIHEDLSERSEENEERLADYQSLPDDDHDSALSEFLASLGITRQYVDDAQVPWNALSKLYQQEFSCASWLKWSSLDHALEKNLQWPLLSPYDVGSGDPQKCDYRVRPQERSILLKTTWGLTKAYTVRGFVQGLETGLLKSVHYFIYAMLVYRLEELVITGRTQLKEFQAIFEGSSQKGIDSLVKSLAQLDAQWLKLILVAPLILGALQGIVKIRGARLAGIAERQKIADSINLHLIRPSSFWRDVILEEISLLSNFLSLGRQVQKLEQWVRWDGRLDYQSRKQAFELIRRVAREGKKITQLNALESLAKIAHGIGFKDLPRLQQAGYSPQELTTLLYTKAMALVDLKALSQKRSGKVFASSSRRLYASYLLWWLGLSTSWWTQRLPFSLLKTVKLGLEVLFLQKIVGSILEAIHCPDKPGFQFGTGYEDWASDYTVTCFITRLKLFRTIDTNESVAILVAEISRYHLTELTELDLSSKYLTAQETAEIIQAVVQQGAPLKILDLHSNQISTLREGVFSGLSHLTFLDLNNNQISVLSKGIFSGLSRLTHLYFGGNPISVLSEGMFSGLSQLTFLDVWANEISVLSEGVFNELSQLTSLDLSANQISVLSEVIFSGLSQLTSLKLWGNQISVLSEGVFNGLSQLTKLHLGINQISILSKGIFSGLSQLTSLDLFDNQISVLSEGVFNELSQLALLRLDNNQISVLRQGVLSGLSQLIYLDLRFNEISFLSQGVFNGLSQITSLYLDDNQINVLSEGIFSELNQLQNLYLSGNQLNTSTLVSILSSLPATLIGLDISSNQINTLPQNFSSLLPVGLKYLWVGGNVFISCVLTREFMQYFPFQLTTLGLRSSLIVNITDNSFSDFSALSTLYLQNNQISLLSEGMFNGLSQLTYLHLASNQISVLSEGVFNKLSQLTTLYLWYNEISVLSQGAFNGLSQLTRLELDGNRISVLSEDVFNGLSQLTNLDLSYNKINVLSEGVFSKLSQLTTLYLSSNEISVLSQGAFNGLSQLTYLSLSSNQISVLGMGIFGGLKQLTDLYLGSNQISVLSEGVFNRLSQLTTLSLSYNQLNDTAVKNLTRYFPYQLRSLALGDNQISNEGAQALAEIFPCTNLTTIYFSGNPANDTVLAVAAQQKALKKVCDDQRCYANLPATESCGVNTNPSTAGQMTWGLFNSTDEEDKTKSDFSDYSDWSHPAKTSLFQPALALPSTTSESSSLLLSTKTAGAMILGMAGLSILFYKNSTWMQAIVNTGSSCFQRCWSSGKSEEAKTSSPVSSSNRRYALFQHLSTFCSRKSCLFTKMSEHHQNFSI